MYYDNRPGSAIGNAEILVDSWEIFYFKNTDLILP